MVKTAKSRSGLVRAAFKDALAALGEERDERPDPPPHQARNGIEPTKWEGAPWDNLPPDCPFQVVGHNEALTYVVSASGQLFAIERWDEPMLLRLVAPYINYAYWAWGRLTKITTADGTESWRINGLENKKMIAAIMKEGVRKGLFDPADRHRGRGGWRDRTGAFLWHSGEWLWRSERGKLHASRPSEHDGALYTRQPDTILPWAEPVPEGEGPAARLFQDLRTWSWERPTLDPLLVVGWLVSAFMGAALDQRPIVFTTGGAGVGKSTLQALVRDVLARAVFASSDTTAAGIYQRVRNDALPVMVDELEPKPGSSRPTAVIELARIAYSGDSLDRGGADHQGVSFTARNSFFFSAINVPPLAPQDRSRMAILNLHRLDSPGRPLREVVLQDTAGRMMLRQIMDGWENFWGRPGEQGLLARWKTALVRAGLSSRGADTYGTLLAAAELVLGTEDMRAAGLPMYDDEALAQLVLDETASERSEQADNWEECLQHLLQSQIEAWKGGEKPTVGGVLDSIGARPVPPSIIDDEVKPKLAAAGLGLVAAGKVCDGYALAIPAKGPVLAKIFRDTKWADGVWFSALKQEPGKKIVLRGSDNRFVVKINKVACKCLLIDIEAYDRASAAE